MSLSVLSPPDTQSSISNCTGPWWGAWSALLILGCFFLTQALGIFLVQMVAGLSTGPSKGVGGLTALDQTWVLPLSLLLGTVGAAMVSWQVATCRAKPSMDRVWFWGLLWKSYAYCRLWRFAALGLSLGVGFFALTEYGVLPPDDLPQPLFDAMMGAPLLLQVGWAFLFVVLFPVVEESLFRGFLFTGLAQSWGPILAGIVTTVLFVAVHMPKVLEYWPALVAVSLIGSLTVLIRIRAGSLAPGIAMHCTYNGALVSSAFLTQPTA
jgi:membrane protease YdiL (CAAX protease family)